MPAAAPCAGALGWTEADENAYIVMVASGTTAQPEAEPEASHEAQVADAVLGEVMGGHGGCVQRFCVNVTDHYTLC